MELLPLNILMMNRVHHFLLHQEEGSKHWSIPSVTTSPQTPALDPCRKLIKDHLELKLPTPSGISLPSDGTPPYGFCFIIETPFHPTTPEWKWVKLSEMNKFLNEKDFDKKFWPLYKSTMLGGFEPARRDLEAMAFGNSPMMASKLAHLVSCGHKRATSGLMEAFTKSGEAIPHAGMLTVVTDFFGHPQCIVETTEVRTVPFKKVGKDVALAEGEGDLTLEDWRVGHRTYFKKEAETLEVEFTEDTMVINEFFKVVQILGHT